MLSRGGGRIFRAGLSLRPGKRNLLSEACRCDQEWAESAKLDMLENLDSYDCLAEVSKKFVGKGTAPGVDVDIAAHAVSEPDQLSQLKEILYSHRHRPGAASIMESTHHAVVRRFIEFNGVDLLMQMLDDPINYGVFPDNQACNLLMDWFIKRENFYDASRVAGYLMKQEMLENPLSCWLSLFSCARLIEDGIPTTSAAEAAAEEEEDDDDQEVVFKYPYLKNPYNDGHFDLTDTPSVVGKSLLWSVRSLGQQSEALLNARLLGLLLLREADAAEQHLSEMKSNQIKLCQNMTTLASDLSKTDDEESTEESTGNELESVIERMNQYSEEVGCSERRLSATINQELRPELAALEAKDMEESREMFNRWFQARIEALEAQSEKVSLRKRLEQIEKTLSEKSEEGLLEYFESRDSLETLARDGAGGRQDAATTQLTDEEFASLLPSLRAGGRLKPSQNN